MSTWQRIVIIRHGQSENVTRWLHQKVTGEKVTMVPDSEDHLTELGQSQVKQCAKQLLDVLKRPPHNFRTTVELVSSSSTRCKETANLMSEELQLGGLSLKSLTYSNDLLELKSHDYTKSDAGENQLQAWNELVFSQSDSNIVKIYVTHGNILRQALANKFQLSSKVAIAPTVASLTVLDVDSNGRIVVHNLCDSSANTVRQWYNEDLF